MTTTILEKERSWLEANINLFLTEEDSPEPTYETGEIMKFVDKYVAVLMGCR
jgi:hypothetical protein